MKTYTQYQLNDVVIYINPSHQYHNQVGIITGIDPLKLTVIFSKLNKRVTKSRRNFKPYNPNIKSTVVKDNTND